MDGTDSSPATPSSAGLSDAVPFQLQSPVEGELVDGARVDVHGNASDSLGLIRASVWLGDAMLGFKDVKVERAGPVSVELPVFAPPFKVPVDWS